MPLQGVLPIRYGFKLAILVAISAIAFVLIDAAVNSWNMQNLFETRNKIIGSQELLTTTAKVFSSLQDAETGQRGFQIAGTEDYLRPYRQAVVELDEQLPRLRNFTKVDPELAAVVTKLEPHITSILNELAQAVKIRREQGRDASREYILSHLGKNEMDAIRRLFSEMEKIVELENANLIALSDASYRRAVWSGIVWACMVIVLIAVGIWLVRREIVIRERLATYHAEQNRAKSDFLAMLGHELRNPLAAIRNSVDVLEMQEKLPDQLEDLRAIMERQTGILIRLADDLLDSSRLNYSKLELQMRPLNLRELLERVAEDQRTVHRGLGINLELAHCQEAVWIEGDEPRLCQVISNLLHNAYKFSQRGQTIRVALAAESAQYARLSVTDQGEGIDPATLQRMFEPFAQGRASDRVRGGLGLGLALARGFIELHHGEILASSPGRGRGASFTIKLPRITAPAIFPEAKTETAALKTPQCVIVIIDDRRDASHPLRRMLELLGHQVYVAAEGQQGILLAREHTPDLVLCDIGLPGMSGFEVAEQLQKVDELRNTLLVAITGYGQDEIKNQAREAGFHRLLTKPISLANLHEIIADLPCSQPAVAATA